jgi:hypothetical protein
MINERLDTALSVQDSKPTLSIFLFNKSHREGESHETSEPALEDLSLGSIRVAIGRQTAPAQDPVKVDAKHYKVEFENDQVRVLRIKYGPGEKSLMHDHPDSTAVFLTEQHVKFAYPDGKTEQVDAKAGETRWTKGGKHLPENAGTKPFELILVELKTKSAKSK